MSRGFGRWWVAVLGLLAPLGAGCVHRSPLVRLDAQTPLAVVVVLDEKDLTSFDAAPPELLVDLDRELARRNLIRQTVPIEALQPLTQTRNSKTRRELLAQALGTGSHRLFALIELKVLLFDQFQGGYKWTIDGALTVGGSDDLDESTTEPLGLSVFLNQDFEREREALQQGATAISDKLGRALDDHFAGRVPGHPGSEHRFQRSAIAPPPWPARSIYFVLLDRFAPGEGVAGDVDRNDPAGWHGGTLATLSHHLDDLQALGVGTVWLSPVSRCRERKLSGFGASHCYWVRDLGEFEPRFGSIEELRGLREALHARGMRLVLDVVLNHVAPDSPLLAAHPDWFHAPKVITDYSDRDQLETGRLGGLPDLAQETPAVASYLISATEGWISRVAPDGLRLDAVKHIPASFWSRFSHELQAVDHNLVLIGEDLTFDPVALARTARAGGFGALFDFPLQSAILGAVCGTDGGTGGSVGSIAARLGLDRLVGPGLRWVTLLDNHDLPRLRTVCGSEQRSELALSLLFALRGIPSLTYGTEAGLQGTGDPLNRGDLDFPVRSELARRIAEFASLRASHPALVNGQTVVLSATREELQLLRIAPTELAWLRLGPTSGNPAPSFGGGWSELWATSADGLSLKVSVTQPVGVAAETLAALLAGQRSVRPVRFDSQGAPALQRGDSLAVVGGAPELGDWDPRQGLPVSSLATPLPANRAYELKLVVRRANGAIEWQPGPNAVMYLTAGDTQATVSLRWTDQG